jgi:cell division transport system permease protein
MIRRLFSARVSLLPRDAGGEAWLAALIAVLCLLACLAAAGAVAADRAAQGWARELRAEATVQVRPRVGETGAEAAARAAQTLAGVEGVSEAEAMDRETAEALLRPWIGAAALPDLPVPHLVTVRLDRTAPASAVTLGRALAEAGLDATVDDHGLWRREVERSAGLITLLAGAGFLLTAGAAGAAVAYATRAGMAAQAGVISILSLNGASDGAIAGLYQWRYGRLAAGAGALGALVAMGTVAGLRLLGGTEGVTPALPLAWSDLLILSPCPLLAGTVGLVTARVVALARLGRGH